MHPRQAAIEQFSTFLQFTSETASRWSTDLRLQRSMKQCVAETGTAETETFWVLYWHRLWQTTPNALTTAHLIAYLQEACYWAAWAVARSHPSSQTLTDLFQTAIADIPKILKGFNPQFSASLKNYGELIFRNSLKSWLSTQREAEICSDWSLLHRVSQKRLRQALQTAGLDAAVIERCVLVWQCYRECYAPQAAGSTRRLEKPDAKEWEAIARLYQSEHLSQKSTSAPATSAAALERDLLTSAKAIRAYLRPPQVSLNAPLSGQEGGEFQDVLPADTAPPMEIAIAQEEADTRATQWVQLQEAIATALQNLDSSEQELLNAYYAQNWTQTQIAQQLGIKQYNISRQLSRIRQKLLRAIGTWSQEVLHISLNPGVLDAINEALELCLQSHFARSITHTASESS